MHTFSRCRESGISNFVCSINGNGSLLLSGCYICMGCYCSEYIAEIIIAIAQTNFSSRSPCRKEMRRNYAILLPISIFQSLARFASGIGSFYLL